MSNEAEVETEVEVEVETEVEVEVEAEEKPAFDYQANQEDKASQGGWKPLKDWEEAGGKPEDWVDAPTFNVKGEFIGKFKHQAAQHSDEIANLNQLHRVSMDAKVKELQDEKHEAALKGGEEAAERIKNIDHEIGILTTPAQAAPAKDPQVVEWEAANSWINTPGAKSTYANAKFKEAQDGGYNTANALAYVNQEMAKEYPAQTRKKETTSMSEKGNGPSAATPKAGKLTMSDLTPQELKLRTSEASPPSWAKDEKAFLKAVQNSREL